MKVGVLVLLCFVCVKSILSHDNFVYSTHNALAVRFYKRDLGSYESDMTERLN